MLADIDPTAFIHTNDVERSRAFYVEVLGLESLEESPFALVVRSGRTTIRVTPVETPVSSGATVLGWSVADITEAVDDLAGRGVEFLRFDGMDQDSRGIWQAPGAALVAWFADPDGNTLSLTQEPN